jgi:LacI family transcriptional regulator
MRTVLLAIESSRGSGRSLLNGIVKYSRIHKQWSFHWEPAGLGQISSNLNDVAFDGIIMRDSKENEKFFKLDIPIIVVRHSKNESPAQINIVTDYKTIGIMAANHLLERGFKHYGFCGFYSFIWSKNRCEVFTDTIQKAGYDVHLFGHKKFRSWDQENDALSKWLKTIPKPIGIMCCNDDRSYQVAQICKSLDINIPDSVALIGVDNDELVCELSDPPLSSVSINFERAGFEAAAFLDQLMEGKKT